jgi:hypothetical protein
MATATHALDHEHVLRPTHRILLERPGLAKKLESLVRGQDEVHEFLADQVVVAHPGTR